MMKLLPFVVAAAATATATAARLRGVRGSDGADDDGAPSTTLLMWNNSLVVPGTQELFTVNMHTQEKSVITTTDATYNFVSDSVLCGKTVYSVATNFPIAWGILRVNVEDGTNEILDTGTYLFHRLQCTDDETVVLGVGSDFGNNPTGKLQFSLQAYDASAQETKTIGVVPNNEKHHEGWQGYDNAIEFFPAANEVWVNLDSTTGISPVENSGYLFILDTETGKLKVDQEYHHNTGAPFLIVPSKDNTFQGMLFNIGSEHETTKWCTFDRSQKVIQETGCKDTTAQLGFGGTPAPMCDGSLWVSHNQIKSDDDQFDDVSPGTGGQALLSQIDPSTGEILYSVDKSSFIDHYYEGSIACGTQA